MVIFIGMAMGIIFSGLFATFLTLGEIFNIHFENPLAEIKNLAFYSYISVMVAIIAVQILFLLFSGRDSFLGFRCYIYVTLYWTIKSIMFYLLISLVTTINLKYLMSGRWVNF
ncbi:MAG: hypothetical protein Harvfovirus5_33 [Harvfovirus sp.]|uniref:Uncharacterized protein n=1 Tax=Harvfovirus sp. TaxID=2487768 RepID=A0A3G5A5G3_9VIRU|nr:MAG: hypothetical protein Harvfovirus5_33 [Harvfovirus sp.]